MDLIFDVDVDVSKPAQIELSVAGAEVEVEVRKHGYHQFQRRISDRATPRRYSSCGLDVSVPILLRATIKMGIRAARHQSADARGIKHG